MGGVSGAALWPDPASRSTCPRGIYIDISLDHQATLKIQIGLFFSFLFVSKLGPEAAAVAVFQTAACDDR